MAPPQSEPAGAADIQRLFVRADDIAAARRLLSLVAHAEKADGLSGSHLTADAAQQARAQLMLRRRRVEVLGPRFRSEQPFLILLALYGAEPQEPQITKTRLMRLSWMPWATLERWLDVLCSEGLISLDSPVSGDRRKLIVLLTQTAREKLEEIFKSAL